MPKMWQDRCVKFVCDRFRAFVVLSKSVQIHRNAIGLPHIDADQDAANALNKAVEKLGLVSVGIALAPETAAKS
jgi:hypothetical protein